MTSMTPKTGSTVSTDHAMRLVIGNKNYSSWSLRPWLLMREKHIAFEEIRVPLARADTREALLRYSPSAKVPVLIDASLTVWDSLAIIEYLAEAYPRSGIWPARPTARATARAVSAEIHSSFAALREAMPMNLRVQHPGCGHTPAAMRDVTRIVAIWEDCLARHHGEGAFLFGGFCAADAMYAPAVTRFATYGVELPPASAAYCAAIRALPAMREWTAAALTEPERIAASEIY